MCIRDSQKCPALPACFSKNTRSTTVYGECVADTVASWVKAGYAAGPFEQPPLHDFRTNCLMAVDQGHKIRPILNVSAPEDHSFNDNVDELLCEKVQMATARNVSYNILEAGKGCLLYKTDIKDAYKIVPAKLEDLRLQGFYMLGRYFLETRMIFGAITAVCNYDTVGSVPLLLALLESKIPAKLVNRAVDDVPAVSPASETWGKEFADNYKRICAELNIELAPDCEKFNKAFTGSTYGKILGKWFNTEKLCWKMDDEKKDIAVTELRQAFFAKSLTIKEVQSLAGKLNDISTMMPLMKIFRYEINAALTTKIENNDNDSGLPHAAKEELNFWAGFLTDCDPWHRICPPYHSPPLCPVIFTSDAAGMPTNCGTRTRLGAASISTSEDGSTFFAQRIWWDRKFIMSAKDEKGTRYGDKSTTLEAIGLLLPLLAIPHLLVNKHIVLRVDNIGCYYGMLNKRCSGDKTASVIIRTIVLLEAVLGSRIHLEHLPRRSNWESETVDDMSREDTTDFFQHTMLERFSHLDRPTVIEDWMKNPMPNWDLAQNIVNIVREKI